MVSFSKFTDGQRDNQCLLDTDAFLDSQREYREKIESYWVTNGERTRQTKRKEEEEGSIYTVNRLGVTPIIRALDAGCGFSSENG